jgi:hypothetical protein
VPTDITPAADAAARRALYQQMQEQAAHQGRDIATHITTTPAEEVAAHYTGHLYAHMNGLQGTEAQAAAAGAAEDILTGKTARGLDTAAAATFHFVFLMWALQHADTAAS